MAISKDSGTFLLERPAEKEIENGIIYVPEAKLRVVTGTIDNCYRCSEEDEARKPRAVLETELRQKAEIDRINGNIVFTGDYDENLHVYALAACETNGKSLEGRTESGETVALSEPRPGLLFRAIPNYYDFDEPRTKRSELEQEVQEDLKNLARKTLIQPGQYFENKHAYGIVFNEFKAKK